MARIIDLTKPMSEAELKYLVQRDRWKEIRTNAENLGIEPPAMPSKRDIRAQRPRTGVNARKREDSFEAIAKAMGIKTGSTAEEPMAPEQSTSGEQRKVDYSKLTVPQLKEELDKRRADYEAAGDTDAVEDVSYIKDDLKDDLVAKLQLDDEASNDE